MSDTATLQAQLATLESVLTTLDATRASLPALLRSFTLPASSAAQRAYIYRTYSNQCTASIDTLSDALLTASTVLQAAEESEKSGGSQGVVVRLRQRPDEGWDRLAQLMAGQIDDSKGKQRATVFENALLPREGPRSTRALREQVDRWARSNKKLRGVEVDEAGRQISFELMAVMRAVVMVRWSKAPDEEPMAEDGDGAKDSSEGGSAVCQVERVACFGVKEDRSAYLQSQHSLHQSLTNQAMALIENSRQRANYASQSNLEEVLAFLASPPLPF